MLLFLRSLEFLGGLYYLVMGLDGFFNKIPRPKPSDNAIKFLQVLEESKYILFTVKCIEILVGFCWLTQHFTGLAWILFTPILFNILGYHFFVNKKEILLPTLLLILHLALAYKNSDYLLLLVR